MRLLQPSLHLGQECWKAQGAGLQICKMRHARFHPLFLALLKTKTPFHPVFVVLIEGNLEVKLPTIWTDGKAEVGRVREEKKRSKKIREEKE